MGLVLWGDCQISGIVAVSPPGLLIWDCFFLIFSASSMPLITTSAVRKLLSPSIGPELVQPVQPKAVSRLLAARV
jgi:hypothetical protein